MSSAIFTTGRESKSLMPGVRKFFGMGYDRYAPEYSKIFEVMSSDKNFEEMVNQYGFGYGAVVPEGTDVAFDYMGQGPVKRFVHVKYGKGMILTEESIADNVYLNPMQSGARAMGEAMRQTKETVHANILNRANNSSYFGYDGVSFSNSAHVRSKGGTYSNQLASPSNLNELAIEQAMIGISKFKDDAGLNLQARGELLVIPTDLQYEAMRILKSELKNDTPNNAINALKSDGGLQFTVNHYLTSATKWFIKTSVQDGLISFQRSPITIVDDTDFNSSNYKYKMTERYSCSWCNPMGMYFNGE